LTPIAFIGLLLLAGWNLRQSWVEKRGWFSKTWAAVMLLASAILLWVVLAFHVISFGTNY
jgi:hypothetical protein